MISATPSACCKRADNSIIFHFSMLQANQTIYKRRHQLRCMRWDCMTKWHADHSCKRTARTTSICIALEPTLPMLRMTPFVRNSQYLHPVFELTKENVVWEPLHSHSSFQRPETLWPQILIDKKHQGLLFLFHSTQRIRDARFAQQDEKSNSSKKCLCLFSYFISRNGLI